MTEDEPAVTHAQRHAEPLTENKNAETFDPSHARPMTAAERQRKRREKIKRALESLTPEERFRRDLLDFVEHYRRTLCPEIIKRALVALSSAKAVEIACLSKGDVERAERAIDGFIAGDGVFPYADCGLNSPARSYVTCAKCHEAGVASADETGPPWWTNWRDEVKWQEKIQREESE